MGPFDSRSMPSVPLPKIECRSGWEPEIFQSSAQIRFGFACPPRASFTLRIEQRSARVLVSWSILRLSRLQIRDQRTRRSSPRSHLLGHFSTAFIIHRLNPFACSSLISGGMTSTCRSVSTSMTAGPSWEKAAEIADFSSPGSSTRTP